MDAIELLSTRASNGKLGEPAPDAETLNEILDAALRAPDHGALRPWKILVLRGEARARLGDLFRERLARIDPDASEEQLSRAARKPLRAPLVLVVAATPREHPMAPEIEQILSAGAVAHGILYGLHARGYAGLWRTGGPAYDPEIKEALGLRREDHIVAFLHAGTATAPAPEMPRPAAEDLVVSWP